MTANGVDLGASVPCLRTLGTGSQQAAAGNRGVPSGGTSGYVLSKSSGSDYDLAWAQRATPLITGRISSRWMLAGCPGQPTGTSGTITLDRLYAIPLYIGESQAFDRIGVNGLGTASSKMRIGIYSDNNCRPGTLLVDSGQLDTSISGAVDYTISQTISGLVWVAAVTQSVAASTSRLGAAVANPFIGSTDHYSVSFAAIALSQNSISSGMPSSWGSTYNVEATANTVPQVFLRNT